ncbi:hypothetical protein [Xenorhabdus eapokensis]|uniref:Uncharacterized protein n=1 Tax=Xenorhabdus eapokensis TaxID=1873482 RepID=A0A1Q5TKR1_9GAMM|nr:hypothetical protein [Xenorhabdus eapokensis]OKP00812.1 hypothetical protein Xedl_03126 [Xenorhabdus eapokensis]
MLNIKLSIFIVSLVVAVIIGGVGTTLVLNISGLEKKSADCDLISHEKAFLKQRHSGVIINTGRDKGY